MILVRMKSAKIDKIPKANNGGPIIKAKYKQDLKNKGPNSGLLTP